MTRGKKITLWTVVSVGILGMVFAAVYFSRRKPVVLRGAVLREDSDPNKQLPLPGVEIRASNGLGSAHAQSNAQGFFSLTLPKGLRRRQPVLLQFRLKDYKPLDWNDFISDKLYVARMVPLHQETVAETHSDISVANPRIRYTVKTTAEADIGSAVRAFDVVNVGNTPCANRPPCAPGGKWKATIRSFFLDAGEGNEFRNTRVSCIAGPCPFTKIESETFSEDRRRFIVTIRNWSDTTTFLVEAEVVHPMTSNLVRETYPVIFGRALNFSLPPAAEGPSIEADVAGEGIVFPLGPDLFLRWANCQVALDKDQSRDFRCELKPGYRFH
ncbi:MAG: hypothetical protein WCF22_16135 [Candidatus Sulfotelmatobacter sp.]